MIDAIRPWAIGIAICLTIGFGSLALIARANIKIEAKCLQSGGTVITNPGQLSMCAQSPLDDATSHPQEVER